MSVFTEADFAAYAGVAVKATDYASGHDYAEEFVERYTHATLSTQTVTGEEHLYVTGYVPLSVLPVQSVSSVVDEDASTVSTDYYSLSIRKLGLEFAFESGDTIPKRVTIDYTAGLSVIPADLKRAAMEICKQRILPCDTPAQSVDSLSAGGVTYNFTLANWKGGKPTGTDWVDAVLNAHRIRII